MPIFILKAADSMIKRSYMTLSPNRLHKIHRGVFKGVIKLPFYLLKKDVWWEKK